MSKEKCPIKEMETALQQHYQFRYNIFMDNIEFRSKDSEFEIMTEYDLNSICLKLQKRVKLHPS